jgi:hypothetical protein
MRPLPQVQNPKHACSFQTNSTIGGRSEGQYTTPAAREPCSQTVRLIVGRLCREACLDGEPENRAPQLISNRKPSSSDEAAVSQQRPACDPSGAVGSQEGDNVGDIVGHGHSAERRRLLDARSKIVGQPCGHGVIVAPGATALTVMCFFASSSRSPRSAR